MALDGAIVHSGPANPNQNLININMDMIRSSVHVIMFVVSGIPKHNKSTRILLSEVPLKGEKHLLIDLEVSGIGSQENTSFIACCLRRGKQYGEWIATKIGVATEGTNWQECKEAIRMEAEQYVNEDLKCERNLSMEKTYEMSKGMSASLPVQCRSVYIGLGW